MSKRKYSHKVGARNAAADKQRIVDIRTKAREIAAITTELEPEAPPTPEYDVMKAGNQDGVMVAFFIAPDVAQQLADSVAAWPAGSEVLPTSEMHVTLAYLGTIDELSRYASEGDLLRAVAGFAQFEPLIYGNVSGSGRFVADPVTGMEPVYASVDAPELAEFQDHLVDCFEGIVPPSDHGFTPHITLAYVPTGKVVTPNLAGEIPLVFDTIAVAWGGRVTEFPLNGMARPAESDMVDMMAKASDLPAAEGTDHGPLTRIVAVKSETGEWLLDVLGVPYGGPNGGKDSDGEYFDAATKLYLDKYPSVPAVYYHGYSEKGKPMGEPQFIGKTLAHEVRTDGVWFRVVLDKANAYAHRIWDAALKGVARASSGSIIHLVRYGAGGHITHWPVAELSLIDAVGHRQPANPYAVAVPVLKAVYAQAGLTWPDDIDGDAGDAPEADAKGEQQSADAAGSVAAKAMDNPVTTEDIHMTLEELQAAMAAEFAKKEAADAAKRQADVDLQAKIDAGVAAKMAERDAQDAAARRLPGWSPGNAPAQTQFGNLAKFDDLDAGDLAILVGLTQAAKGANLSQGPSEDLRRALAIRLAEASGDDAVQYSAAKSAMKAAGLPIKSNEINQSTLANYGDEWIGVTYSTQLWDKIRLATPIVAKLPTVVVPQGSESVIIPLQGTSPTFYKMAQAADLAANPGRPSVTITASQLGTAKQTLTVAKLGAAVNYGGELEEDSLIPWVSELRGDLTAEAAEILEHLAIDGDTDLTATTNINNIGGTPAATAVYTVMNGFRKLALITNTANARSAGGLFAITDFLNTVKLMGLAGKNAADKRAVGFITDMWTHWASLNLTEVKTRDVFVAPTVENGMLTNVYGYDVTPSPNMHRANQDATYGLKANTAGKVDLNTAANNTTGSILAVRWDQWRFGYKRRISFEIQRDAISDSTVVVATMRVGMINRDTEAAAITYNVSLS